MSGRVFTEEQAAAIDRRGGSLLLSAAAGSGKTTVLVERFVRGVLDDGIAPAAMLAITFTDKAAGELRARVRSRFLELGERGLAQQTEAAWISTIHGFCARVLRRHAVSAGLAPGFVVLDEATARELRSEAFDAALAGFLDGAAAPRAAALDLVAAYRPDRLATMVLDSYDTLRACGRAPRLPLPPPAPYPNAERAALEQACGAALIELGGVTGTLARRALGIVEGCAAVLEALAPEQPPAPSALDAARFASGKTKALQGPGVAAYLAAREAFAAACADRAAQAALELLDELLDRFATAYAAAKRELGGLDYDDLELATRDLLGADPALASSYARQFDRVMVDEFQDVNRLQLELLEALDRDNVFLVGDELQSIYGFRHASVEVFRERRAELAASGAAASLRINFRSRPEILDVVNRIPHPGAEPIAAGRDASGGDPRVELLLCDRDAAWPDDDPLPAGQPWRRAEARIVAARVAELVASGAHAAGDIVVLLRASGDMATYERALEDAGLGTLAAGGRGFWARQQVLDLCAYLAALVNPRDERALLGVLASPLGASASPDALALLAIAGREQRRPLWELLRSSDVWAGALEPEERARIAAFADVFASERTRAPRLGLDALLERAVRRSRYDEHVLRLPGGVRRLANVAKMIRLAAAFEATRGRDVRALVDRALSELEAGAREPDAPVELAGLDAVRLMTMHAAKGLEFPVVVLADLGRAPNLQTPDLLVEGDRVGLRLVSMHGPSTPTLDYARLREERLDRDVEEERRIMHVAMTRAEERLILAGGVCLDPWPEPKPTAAPIAWLAPALAPSLPAAVAEAAADLAEAAGDVVVDGIRVAVHRPEPVMSLFAIGGPAAPADASAAAAEPAAPPEDVEPVLPRAPLLPALSYSALSRYAQCGYRFYLDRILRLPPRDPPPAEPSSAASADAAGDGIDALTRGSLAHELLELLVADEPRVPSDEEVRAQAALQDIELRADEVQDLQSLVAAALDNDVMRRVQRARSVHREQSFAVALDAAGALPLLHGVVDVLAWERDGGALVVDYKTDRLLGADPEQAVEQAYGLQRRIYALAALRAGASRAEVAHLFLERPDAPAVAVYEPADAAALADEVLVAAGALLAASFPVTDSPHRELCATCPGRGGLCSWPEDVVLRPLADAVG